MNRFSGIRPDFFVFAAAAAVALTLWLPGDIPFLRDEALLLDLALEANEAGRPAAHGLVGTLSVAYGALAVWLHQIALCVTSNPVVIASMKSALSVALSFAAIRAMAKLRNLAVGPAAVLWFASPFVFFYSRALWDNVWLLPMSLGFFYCAMAYWKNFDRRALAGVVLLLAAMVYLHWMALVLPAAFAVTTLLLRRRMPRREWGRLAVAAAAGTVLILPHAIRAARDFSPLAVAPPPPWSETVRDAVLSFANLTGCGFLERFAPDQCDVLRFSLTAAAGCVIAGLILLALPALRRARRSGEWSCFDAATLLAAVAAVMQMAAILVLNRPHHAHYNSAVTAAFWLLAWRGFVALQADYRRAARRMLGFAATVQIALCAVFLAKVDAAGGSPSEHFGPVLASQWDAAKILTAAHRRNPALEVGIEIERFQREPEPVRVLILLAERIPALPEAPECRRVTLRNVPGGYGMSALCE